MITLCIFVIFCTFSVLDCLFCISSLYFFKEQWFFLSFSLIKNNGSIVWWFCFCFNSNGTRKLIAHGEYCLVCTKKWFWKNPHDVITPTKTRSMTKNEGRASLKTTNDYFKDKTKTLILFETCIFYFKIIQYILFACIFYFKIIQYILFATFIIFFAY